MDGDRDAGREGCDTKESLSHSLRCWNIKVSSQVVIFLRKPREEGDKWSERRREAGGRVIETRMEKKKGITADLSFLSSWMRHRHTFNTATLISLAFYSLTFSAALLQAWIIQQERCAAARQRAHQTATYPWKKRTRIDGLQHLTADLRNLRTFGVCMAPERGWFRLKGQISHEMRKMSIMLFLLK